MTEEGKTDKTENEIVGISFLKGITGDDAKILLGLSDDALATIGNRYNYDPTKSVAIIGQNITSEDKRFALKVMDGARGFIDSWASVSSSKEFLDALGVKCILSELVGSDGNRDVFYHQRWGMYVLGGTAYDFNYFVPAIRWALRNIIEENGEIARGLKVEKVREKETIMGVKVETNRSFAIRQTKRFIETFLRERLEEGK